MQVLAEELVNLTDTLKEAVTELSIGLLENNALLMLAEKLDLVEAELDRVRLLMRQEQTIVQSLKTSLSPISAFFVANENVAPNQNTNNSVNGNVNANKKPTASMKSSATTTSTNSVVKAATSNLASIIEQITEADFEALPKYLKGRLNAEKINKQVVDLNRLFQDKYTLLLRGNPAKMSLDQRQRYYDWKQCENEETRGKYFITETDIKTAGKFGPAFKLDQVGRSILTILRHVGRIKEVRSPGIVRFVAAGLEY